MNKRDAINEILLSLNELPLDESDAIESIGIAVIVDKELCIAQKKVLAEGWNFNTVSMSLYPNTLGYIIIPNTFLSVRNLDDSGMVVRDWKLFNKTKMTYLFTEPVVCEVVQDIVFDDIPFHAANYIIQVASLQAYIDIVGSENEITVKRTAVQLAKIETIRDESNSIDGNMLEEEYATTLLDRAGM